MVRQRAHLAKMRLLWPVFPARRVPAPLAGSIILHMPAARGAIDRATTPVIKLARDRLGLPGDSAQLDDLAERFRRHHAVHLPQFLAPDAWALVQRYIDQAQYEIRVHEALDPPASNLTIVEPTLVAFCALALNDPAVTRVVRRITGCDPIGSWMGDFYRMVPGQGHRDSWHDDVDDNRLVAITINLAREPFRGGALSMRDKATREVLWTFTNDGRGDAVLFRIDRGLEHWTHDVEGDAPKSAVAGWFQRTPLFWEELPQLCDPASSLSAEAPR